MENQSIEQIIKKVNEIPLEKWKYESKSTGPRYYEFSRTYKAKLKEKFIVEVEHKGWDYFGIAQEQCSLSINSLGKTILEIKGGRAGKIYNDIQEALEKKEREEHYRNLPKLIENQKRKITEFLSLSI